MFLNRIANRTNSNTGYLQRALTVIQHLRNIDQQAPNYLRDFSTALHNDATKMDPVLKFVIIGSGPAAHTAAIYAARAKLNPVMYEGFNAGGYVAGGQLTTTTDVENFPGFPDGISGIELTDNFRKQSHRFGTQIITETISKVDFSSRPFKLWTEGKEDKSPILSHAVIIATGATAKKLLLPGEEKYWNRGVSACAVCDGALPIFRDKPLAVIGGGDSAAEESMFLTKYASKVYLIHRRDTLRASKIMADRVLTNKKIEFIKDTIVEELKGDGKVLTSIIVRNKEKLQEIKVNGFFLCYWACAE